MRSQAVIQLADRTGPDDGVAAVEEDVAREDDALLGQMDDHIPGGVRRTDFDQGHRAVADPEVEPALECPGGQGQRHVIEGERCEDTRQEVPGRTECGCGVQHGSHRRSVAGAPSPRRTRAEEMISDSATSALP